MPPLVGWGKRIARSLRSALGFPEKLGLNCELCLKNKQIKQNKNKQTSVFSMSITLRIYRIFELRTLKILFPAYFETFSAVV